MKGDVFVQINMCGYSACMYGGGRGIRTPVDLRPNGFQDRPVMTTSVSLHCDNKTNFNTSIPKKSIGNELKNGKGGHAYLQCYDIAVAHIRTQHFRYHYSAVFLLIIL
jgi:hypothetical protein